MSIVLQWLQALLLIQPSAMKNIILEMKGSAWGFLQNILPRKK